MGHQLTHNREILKTVKLKEHDLRWKYEIQEERNKNYKE